MIFHDPHMIPEPILVISGLSYLIPMCAAFSRKRWYDAGIFLALTCTTVGFLGTRSETWFFLDCLAILQFLGRGILLSRKTDSFTFYSYWAAILYSLVSYFVGQQFSIMSFHPDWNTQMFFHSIMHLSSALSAYMVLCKIGKITD